MKNESIRCNVCECTHNDCACNCCTLNSIEVTHDKTAGDVVPNPHYCKSYKAK